MESHIVDLTSLQRKQGKRDCSSLEKIVVGVVVSERGRTLHSLHLLESSVEAGLGYGQVAILLFHLPLTLTVISVCQISSPHCQRRAEGVFEEVAGRRLSGPARSQCERVEVEVGVVGIEAGAS